MLDFAYKIARNQIYADYWSIGGYIGYIIPLNNQPWIYSKGNRLTTDKSVTVDNLTFGIYGALTLPFE